jgi:hypothetical protein
MSTRNATFIAVTALALSIGVAAPATADAQGNASCIGFEASSISPAGTSEEFPDGVPQLLAVVRDAFGSPIGAIISEEAHRHSGSHEACDAGE